MHRVNHELTGWIPIQKLTKFGVVDTILLEQLFTFCGCRGISPLLCLAMQLVLVSKYPVFKIDTAIIRLVITIACTAKKNDYWHQQVQKGDEQLEGHKPLEQQHYA